MIWLACCLPYDINLANGLRTVEATINTRPFFARVEANTEAEARILATELARKTWPEHRNHTSYVVEESAITGLDPWTWNMMGRLASPASAP